VKSLYESETQISEENDTQMVFSREATGGIFYIKYQPLFSAAACRRSWLQKSWLQPTCLASLG